MNQLRRWLLTVFLAVGSSQLFALTGAERLQMEQERRASELFAKAQRYALRGAPGNAVETLETLVRNYPRSRWAGAAQWEIAKLYGDNHQNADAFDACQLLIDHFPDYFEAALDMQFRLAKKVLVRYEDLQRHPDALKPKQLLKKETVSEMLRIIIRNGPHWERVAEAQYLLGVALEKEGKTEEARRQHESFAENHKGHELADDAAYQIAYIDYKAWKRMRGDAPQARERAETSLLYFIAKFPDSSKAAQANGSLIEIRSAEMRELQRLAEFYDKQGKDKAAAIYYLTLVRRFPEAMALPGLEERLNGWLQKYPEMAVAPAAPLPPAPPEYLAAPSAPAAPEYDPIKYPVLAPPAQVAEEDGM